MVSKCLILFVVVAVVVLGQIELSNASWYYNLYKDLSRNSCSPPARPYNGKYRIPHGAQQFGGITTVGYECNRGYQLVGTSYNSCRNKRWMYRTPRCVIEDPCRKSSACSYYATCRSSYGRKTCTCKPGYSGNAYSRRGCNKMCKQPYPFSNLYWTPVKSQYNKYDRVTFSCSPGYELRGSSSSMCSSYGIWTVNTSPCKRIVITTTTEALTTTTTTISNNVTTAAIDDVTTAADIIV